MNKSKKLAFAAVAVVMAGAMAASIAGCKDNNDGSGSLEVKTDANGQLTYASGTTIKTALGYNSNVTGIKYDTTQISKLGGGGSSMTYAGKTYVSGDLKPAWQALTSELDINVVDEWAGSKDVEAGKHISYLKQNNKLGDYSLITASATTILGEDTGTWLDINEYLDYMPNYKQFLKENDIVRFACTANTSTGAMYMIPYFDGNNDIEKYVLMRKDIVEKILDATDLSSASGTFASQATTKNAATNKGVVTVVGTAHSVESFMGKVAADNYKIKVTDPAALRAADTSDGELNFGNNLSYVTASKKNDTVELTVDYGAVIAALQDSQSALYAAAKAPLKTDTAVQTASGNIIDIQNQMIDDSNGAVTGAQLTKVLQEYIKVAYHKTGESTPFYTKLSDVFNSAYAAWDVDLYVALGRASMASSALLGASSKGENAYFLGSRTGFTNRTYDIASMAGELYGVRGLTSRYNSLYAYIDKAGNIKDARNEEAYWNALSNMSKLAKEGLYYTGEGNKDGYASIANSTTNPDIQFYSSTDYVQTQTRLAGYSVDGKLNKTIEAGYNYAPILTPVSRWDVDGDGTREKVMRFTESWRGVKDGGLCIPKAAVQGDPDKLSATLKVIDWMFSNDGQMVMTYGPFSKAGNITRTQGATANAEYGTWYGKPVDKTLDQAKTEGIVETIDNVQYRVKEEYKGQYFCYNNKLYTGTYYDGRQVPTPTDEVMTELMEINEGKFTDHARQYIGSALNFGNKDQGFEAQCTPNCGLVGANIWAIAKVNGTIVHTVPGLTNDSEYGYWLTLVPTVLPFSDAQTSAMKTSYQKVSGFGSSSSDNYFYANSSAKGNILTDIMYYGFDTSKTFTGVGGAIPGNAAGVIATLNNAGMSQVDGYMDRAWKSIKDYYTTLTAGNN